MDKTLIEAFRRVATAAVADAVDKICGRKGYLDSAISPRTRERKIAGPAVIVLEGRTDEFLPPQHALDLIHAAEEGSVVAISIGGHAEVAIWGMLMTAGAGANRLEAAVLDGAVRDVTEIKRDFGFPVFARSTSPGTTLGRFKELDSNVTVTIGDVTINPGDIVVGDVDGVVVVPKNKASEVLVMAQKTDQRERELEQAKLIIASGSLNEGLVKYGRI